jgi:RNA polymerase sigma factor (sigma-70 family)
MIDPISPSTLSNLSNVSPDIFRERLRDLCLRHHGFVRRACHRYVQNPVDADDLAQEVLLKAARGWRGYKGDCAEPTWLYRVATNHCADHLRRRRRHADLLRLYARELEPEYALEAFSGLEASSPDGFGSGFGGSFRVTGADETEALRRVLDLLMERLHGTDQHVARLRFEVGLRQRLIARATGLSRAAVAGRLRKIRDRAERLYREERGRL